jgi:uncharacterized protein (DUF1330 family)
MPAPEFRVDEIVAVLERHGVKYVVIGGIASVLHGSPHATRDVDITPERSQENLTRLSAALKDLNARVRAADVEEGLPFSHDATSLGGVMVWNLTTLHGDLDISFVPSGTEGFDDLSRDAEPIDFHGVTILVASLADVIRSKQAANRPKDQLVLPALREILASRGRSEPQAADSEASEDGER